MTATETENSISAGNWRHRAEAIASIMVVASLPCLVVGPVTFAVFGGIGILLAAFLNGWEANVEALRKFLRSPIGIAIIFTFAAWAPGTIMSLDVGESISVVIRMILFTVVGILLYDFLNNRPQLLRLQLKTIIIGLFFAYFLSTITMVFFPEVIAQIKGYDLMEKHYGKLFFKRYASASVLFAPLLVWGGLALGNRWRIMAFGIVLLLPGYFVLLESRSAIAGLLAAFLIFVLLIGFRYRNKMILIGLWSVVGLGIAGALSYLAARYTSPPVPFDPILPPWLIDPHRQIIWMNTINLAEVKPWFGWGINTANFAINHIESFTIAKEYPPLPGHPHNWIVEVLAETGVFGVLSLMGTVLLSAFLILKKYLANFQKGYLAVMSVFGGFWVSSLFNFSIWSAWWQMVFVVVSTIILANSNFHNRNSETDGQ